jgi:hypothetical protein
MMTYVDRNPLSSFLMKIAFFTRNKHVHSLLVRVSLNMIK